MKSPLLEAVALLGDGSHLSVAQARDAVRAIMAGDAPDVAIAAFLTALRVKGESAEELAGAVEAVRQRSTGWDCDPGASPLLLDTCGTGGDGANTVNISTASAVVVAACGVPIAKHGNRSASGNSGSAEVLAELGIEIEPPIEILHRCLNELGITFLFAPRFHPALRFAAPIRRQLPFRTLFNLVGPLANPARPAYQLIGVPDDRLAWLVARALIRLGIERAAIVTGADGLDEVSLDANAPTQVRWVEAGEVAETSWSIDDFGLAPVTKDDLRVSGPKDSAIRLVELFEGQAGPIRDIVLANAAAALLVAGRAKSLSDGVEMAGLVIDNGEAARLLERWARMSQGL